MSALPADESAQDELRRLAHELSNLLGVIRNHAELLEDVLPSGQQRDDLAEIQAAVTKAAAVADQMRKIARGLELG